MKTKCSFQKHIRKKNNGKKQKELGKGNEQKQKPKLTWKIKSKIK